MVYQGYFHHSYENFLADFAEDQHPESASYFYYLAQVEYDNSVSQGR